jgi:hypothetical protein
VRIFIIIITFFTAFLEGVQMKKRNQTHGKLDGQTTAYVI